MLPKQIRFEKTRQDTLLEFDMSKRSSGTDMRNGEENNNLLE